MKIIAVIPARGGSKGIPGKNIKMLCGRPLISYMIESALKSKFIERVFVSTDSQEISQTARMWGAKVINRPPEISGDNASSESALLHSLEELGRDGLSPEILVFLQCTSPLTLPEDIDGTIRALIENNADSAFSAANFHYFLWKREPDGNMSGINHEKTVRPRRQEREPQYLETGAVYVMKATGFKKAGFRFFGKTAVHVMPPERCLEIDEPVDLALAESFLLNRKREKHLEKLPNRIDATVFDFDGVFTNNSVLLNEEGVEAVFCDRGDGLAISMLKKRGLPILVLSTEKIPIARLRSEKLGLECIHGVDDKLSAMRGWIRNKGLDLANVVYVGNDLNDKECIQSAGCGVAVADAHIEIKAAASMVLRSRGGSGAVREICELIIKKLG